MYIQILSWFLLFYDLYKVSSKENKIPYLRKKKDNFDQDREKNP